MHVYLNYHANAKSCRLVSSNTKNYHSSFPFQNISKDCSSFASFSKEG